VNTAFRLVSGLILMPFLGAVAGLLIRLIRETEEEKAANADFDRLDERFLKLPAVAVEQSRLTVNSMAIKAKENILRAIDLISDYKEEGYNHVVEMEDYIDTYEDKLGTYLVKLNQKELDTKQNERVSDFLHTISDFERISDHAMNVADAAKEIHEKKIVFSEAAQKELEVLKAAIREILELSIGSFVNEDESAQYKVEPLEEHIDVLCDQMKLRHVERMQSGTCSLSVGFVFNDILTNLERVADHCSNVAVAMIELSADAYETHEYMISLKELRSHNFDALYEQYSKKYQI
jgi:phosphate:Na+ symporter